MTSLLPAALRIAERRGMKIPAGIDHLGLRVCRADMTSTHGFRWPFPGHWAEAAGPFHDHYDACPRHPGDGLCIGTSWAGMASGGLPADVVLLVGWTGRDLLGRDLDAGKVRVKRARVVDTFTVAALLAERKADESANLSRANLSGADLSGANLSRANLRGANLSVADLSVADLHGASLYGADLYGADLYGADLYGADLSRANLSGANLLGADLSGANLSGANLSGANLSRASLSRASLSRASLHGADLWGANLRGANLRGANLSGAVNLDKAHGYTAPAS